MDTLGERLTKLRTAKGWTQEQLASKAGVAQSTINGIEKGARQKMPSSLIEIAHALGVDAYWLKTGLGKRDTGQTTLSDEQLIILQAFELFGSELKKHWLDSAKTKIAEHSAGKAKAA